MRRSCTIILVLMLSALIAGCGSSPAGTATSTPIPTPVKATTAVKRGDVIQQVTIGGKIQPVKTWDLLFSASGNVRNLYADQGSIVKKGQLLADLDILNDLETQLAAEEKSVADANAGAERRVRRAQLNLAIAQANVRLAQEQGRSPEEVNLYQQLADLAQLDLDDIQAEVDTSESAQKIQDLKDQIAKASLYAPADGLLMQAPQPGKAVKTSYPAGTIGDPANLELVANGGDAELKNLSEGMTVTVRLEKNPGEEFMGIVRQLPSPYGSGPAETGGLMFAHVTLTQTPAQLGYHIGDSGTVVITLARKTNVLWLPPAAIRSVAGRTFVYIQGPSGPQRINISTGAYNREQVEITDGLTEGQVVILP